MARAGMIGALQDIEAGSQLLPQPALDPQPFLSGGCLLCRVAYIACNASAS